MIDNSYRYIERTFLLPKVNFFVLPEKINFWILKETIKRELKDIKIEGNGKNKKFIITMDSDIFYKSIYCETELFLARAKIQLSEFKRLNNSTNWSFVTLYYALFFNTTCLFRNFNEGFIFFDKIDADLLNNFYEILHSDIQKIEQGNYRFSCELSIYNNLILISFSPTIDLHKSTWTLLYDKLVILKDKCTKDTDEEKIYALFIKLLNRQPEKYLSNLRNRLNYRPEAIVENNQIELDLLMLDDKFLNKLSKLDVSIKENEYKVISFIMVYLLEINIKLSNQLKERNCIRHNYSLYEQLIMTKNID